MSLPRGSDRNAALRRAAAKLTSDPAFEEVWPRPDGAASIDAAEGLVADLAARLRVACGHLSDADFAAVVLDVARMKVRLAAIDERWVQRTGDAVPPVDR